MVDIHFAESCLEMMRLAEISVADVRLTINHFDSRCLIKDGSRFVVIRWFSHDRLLFADVVIDECEVNSESYSLLLKKVTVGVVLELGRNLPSAYIADDMHATEVFYQVVASFGCPLTCHTNRPPVLVYNGIWDGDTPHTGSQDVETIYVVGSFDDRTAMSTSVWALNYDRYRQWFVYGT